MSLRIIIYRNIGLHFRIVSIEPRGKEPPMEAMINMVLAQMQPVLDYLQLKQLKAVLESTLCSHAESSVPNN